MTYDNKMSVVQDMLMRVERSDSDDEALEAQEALEAAVDAMAFVSTLHQSLTENGAKLSEDPDTDEVGTTIDHVFGELSAASLFLSESSFARVPDMLRKIAEGLEKDNAPWTDPQGDTSPPVPVVVIRGFRHLADRLEATKVQKQQAINQLRKLGV